MIGRSLCVLLAPVLLGAAAPDPPEWIQPHAPFRIVPNLYYVGTEGLASYLFVTDRGLVLLDATLPENVPQIEANIRSLGFELRDVKILLNSHAHFDHAGGFSAIKRDTGATLEVMDRDVWAVEHGRHFGDQNYVGTFPAAKVDRVLHDGSRVTLGGLTLRAVLTPGHTPGCTTWITQMSFQGAMRDIVFPCSLGVGGNILVGNKAYPGIVADYRASFARLVKLRADIVLTQHPELAEVLTRSDADRLAPDLLPKIVAEARANFEAELAKQQAAAKR